MIGGKTYELMSILPSLKICIKEKLDEACEWKIAILIYNYETKIGFRREGY